MNIWSKRCTKSKTKCGEELSQWPCISQILSFSYICAFNENGLHRVLNYTNQLLHQDLNYDVPNSKLFLHHHANLHIQLSHDERPRLVLTICYKIFFIISLIWSRICPWSYPYFEKWVKNLKFESKCLTSTPTRESLTIENLMFESKVSTSIICSPATRQSFGKDSTTKVPSSPPCPSSCHLMWRFVNQLNHLKMAIIWNNDEKGKPLARVIRVTWWTINGRASFDISHLLKSR